MATIISPDVFVNELQVGNVASPGNEATLQAFIDKYEPKYLDLILGTTLFTDFYASPNSMPTLLEKVKAPLANYVYYWVMKDSETQSTGTGEQRAVSENAVSTSARFKVARAYNEMVEYNRELREWLGDSPKPFPAYEEPKRSFGSAYGSRERLRKWYDLYTKLNPYL